MPSVLTVQSVERLKPTATRLEVPDATLPGLYFVVQPSGAKSWAVRYRHRGKPRKLTLGSYPALDLGSARSRGREALQVVALGRDPGAEKVDAKRQARDQDPDQDLVAGAVDSFIKRHVRPNTKARSAEETERLFRKHILPRIGRRRLDEIKRGDIIELLDRIVDGGSPVAANRALAAIRKFFNWCVDRGLLESSPCARVKAPTEEAGRDRVLSDEELRLVWLAAAEAEYPFGSLVQFLTLTAQRRDEAARMRWSEVSPDGRLWSIPGERTKNGIPQDVPLSEMAREVLAGVPRVAGCDYVFTSNGEAPVSGFSKSKLRLDSIMLRIARHQSADAGKSGIETIASWRLHDLRRTASTRMAQLKIPVEVTEAILNHVSGKVSGVAAIYNRHKYLDEKREALEAWARFVEACWAQATDPRSAL